MSVVRVLRSFYATPEMLMKLSARAESKGISVAELIVHYIDDGLDRPPCDQCAWRKTLADASKP